MSLLLRAFHEVGSPFQYGPMGFGLAGLVGIRRRLVPSFTVMSRVFGPAVYVGAACSWRYRPAPHGSCELSSNHNIM